MLNTNQRNVGSVNCQKNYVQGGENLNVRSCASTGFRAGWQNIRISCNCSALSGLWPLNRKLEMPIVKAPIVDPICCRLETATVERSSTARASRREDCQQLRIPCRNASSTCGRDRIWASRNRPWRQRQPTPYASLSRVTVADLDQAAAQFPARACQIRTGSLPNGPRRSVRRTAASARQIHTYMWKRGCARLRKKYEGLLFIHSLARSVQSATTPVDKHVPAD